MDMTKEKENQLVQSYDQLIWWIVHRYKGKMSTCRDNVNDLYQECAIVLINHFRKASTEEEARRIPIRDMVNAMCRFNLGEQVVSVPKRTSDFTKKVHSMKATTPWEGLARNTKLSSSPMEDVDGKIMFDSFIGTLPTTDKRIIGYKMNGYSNRETARELGMTDVQITRSLHRSYAAYKQYVQ